MQQSPFSTLSWDYKALKAALLTYVSSATGAILISGGRLRDLSVHNDTHTAVHSFLFSEVVWCPVVSLCKCASVPCNLLYLHSLAPCTKPRRTRTGVEISSDSISQHNISHPKKATMCFLSFPVVVFTVFVLISYLFCDHSACNYLLKFKEIMLKRFEVCTYAQRTW